MLHHKMLWCLNLQIKTRILIARLSLNRTEYVLKPALETTPTALISVDNYSSIQVAMAASEERKCW